MKRYKLSTKFFNQSQKVIPLGSQTFSKSIIMLPKGISPLYTEKAKGPYIWDIDGNKYIDFCNALASVLLGYCNKEVNKVVQSQLDKGVTFSISHTAETQLAKKIIKMVPSAEMVRFGKNGTDATSAAIRIARAYTKKKRIAVCGYHGWQDWYIGSTSRNLGVPNEVKNLTLKFSYNDFYSLEKIFKKYPNDIAAVILEPMNIEYPRDLFLEKIRKITQKKKSVLIFDETITGFRFSKGGAQKLFGVYPDITTLGKGLANGFPLSVICGKKEIMKLMNEIFYSGTFSGEALSLHAALETLNQISKKNVLKKINNLGNFLIDKLNQIIIKRKLKNIISISGHPSWTFLNIKGTNKCDKFLIKTFILQEFFKKGIFFIGTHNLSYAHESSHIKRLILVYDDIFSRLYEHLKKENLLSKIKSEPIKPIFEIR